MKDHKKADDIAAQRVQLIAPLLAQGLDSARANQLKTQICEQTGLSERTLRRYMARHQAEGFEGLKPRERGRQREDAIPPAVVEQAVLLRREVPSRSVSQLIQILEWEGLVQPGEIKRSTLQDRLAAKGYSTRHMRMYAGGGLATRRFQRKHRNQLWHSDIKYGPYLPLTKGGKPTQVYLVTFFDDATRFVLHGEFYASLDKSIVEDCFRKAILKYGVPSAVYFDNGKQYRTKWMGRTCSKMGIRLIFAKPYSPEATGKVERFNRVVDSFLNEAALEKPQTLTKLNELFQVWLTECYQSKLHSAFDGKMSPETAYRSDDRALRFLDSAVIADAFLHCETRRVDKAGCISFGGAQYEVGLNFVGSRVDVIYDPADTTELAVEFPGYPTLKVRKLVIGERTGERPKLPEHMLPAPADSSRVLQAASTKSKQRSEQRATAIAFRHIKAGDKHV